MIKTVFSREEVLKLVNDSNKDVFKEIDKFDFWDENYVSKKPFITLAPDWIRDMVEDAPRYSTVDLRDLVENRYCDYLGEEEHQKLKKALEEEYITHIVIDW